ncbi:MAG: hypothetical protein JNJ83_11670 [Verrucomicrobiaceae bacterium]|nr:hypothetical protein [Verrucomicrobiaceae bacterium]
MSANHYPLELSKKEADLINERRANLSRPDEQGKELDSPPEVGLALSGGGIRSATFCLGVLQALARADVLKKFDFLSTISGGGYIGSFLGRLFTRYPAHVVNKKLTDPLSPEMACLRENGRYLSPNGGGGGMMIAAVYLRNWAGLHFTFGSFVLFVFLTFNLLRFGLLNRALEELESFLIGRTSSTLWWSPWLLLPVAVAFVWLIPAAWAYWNSQFAVMMKRWWRGLATVIGSLIVTGFAVWVWCHRAEVISAPSDQFLNRTDVRTVGSLAVLVTAGISGLMWITAAVGAMIRNPSKGTQPAATLSATRTADVRNVLSNWLRIGLAIVAGSAVLGLVDSFGQTIYALVREDQDQPLLKLVMAGTGLVGLMTLVFKYKGVVGLLTDQGGDSKWKPPLRAIGNAAGYLFLAATLVFWCFIGHALSHAGGKPERGVAGASLLSHTFPESPDVSLTPERLIRVEEGGLNNSVAEAVEDVWVTQKPNTRMLLFWWLLLLVVSWCAGLSVQFLNLSALQTFYGARLRRAYLGAANPNRHHAFSIERNDGSDDMAFTSYKPWENGGPLHLIGTTINETVSGRSQVVDMDRKGLGLSVGPAGMVCGTGHVALGGSPDPKSPDLISIEPVRSPGQDFHMLDAEHQKWTKNRAVEAMTLGNWVSVSGAAFSTGMGANTRSGLSLLLAFFNIRLGYFWDSKIKPWWRENRALAAGKQGGRASLLENLWEMLITYCPVHSHLFYETFGRFHGPNRELWYLSDGGHFENTGCYELVRRRIPFILCCDCGADPDYVFEDMSNIVRKARIDFQAEVTFANAAELNKLGLPSSSNGHRVLGTLEEVKENRASATLAFVRYQGSTKPETCILFLKPTVVGDEPLDVQHYKTTHNAFPQETTLDQFFDEAQWESYRKLGEHIGQKVLAIRSTSGWSPASCTLPP